MVDDKMCFEIMINKKHNKKLLMSRMSEDDCEKSLQNNDCNPMNFTEKNMKGYLFVTEKGYQSSKDLIDYIQLCLNFNTLVKKVKNN